MNRSASSHSSTPLSYSRGTPTGKDSSSESRLQPIHIERGIFAGKLIRFSLSVAQQPIHGRRKTEKDRRPLAHCPIVRLVVSECTLVPGSEDYDEEEFDISNLEPGHLICAATLCNTDNTPSTTVVNPNSSRSTASGHADDNNQEAGPSRIPDNDSEPEVKPSRGSTKRRSSKSSPHEGSGKRSKKRSKGQEIERNLFGGLHVPAVRVPAIDGELGLWFLFSDLSVRQEGSYTLHFKCFDLTATSSNPNNPAPPLAECYSQVFKVYSPRNFPGLPRPTALADHFSKQGFKLNTRKNERSKDSPPPQEVTSSAEDSRPEPVPLQSHGSDTGTLDNTSGSILSSIGRGSRKGHP